MRAYSQKASAGFREEIIQTFVTDNGTPIAVLDWHASCSLYFGVSLKHKLCKGGKQL
jgi:hypothetical protein